MPSLEKYRKKRVFRRTPEPTGGTAGENVLHFVVQKHQASHLHYDFRLEIRGVLKSWAVPKGPSTDPSLKRLAMLVEDHPFDYKDFEGIIPKGNYGAGAVIIWDQGTYEPAEAAPSKEAQEKSMLKQFYGGAIKIIMHGKKLKGSFTLSKLPERGDNSWLLTKGNDKYAKKTDITKKDKSVVSGLSIENMVDNPSAREWQSNRKISKNKVLHSSTASSKSNKGKRARMPSRIRPMLCTLTKEPIDNPAFLYEIKWDGYRIISYVSDNKIRMDSRSSLNYTNRYPEVARALTALKHEVVLDGEVVVFNEHGLPDFDALQKYNGHSTPIHYCVFDILWKDGYNLMGIPLNERKAILKELVANNDVLRFSESFEDGPALYEQMVQRNLEGIIAKKRDSIYVEGDRGNKWLKTPTRKRQEFVIGGWAESDKVRSFKSLLFGAYNNGKLEWIGRSGGGYKVKEMPGILKQLKSLEIKSSPFCNPVLDTKGAIMHWVKPELVANFEFATWTKTGRIRKPATFLGFRKDKKAKQVFREVPKAVDKVEQQIEKKETHPTKPKISYKKKAEKIFASKDSNWKVLEKKKPEFKEEFDLGDCTITLSDVERPIWKKIPKAKLIEYYHSISKFILPHLKNRPLSLLVKPNGALAPGLYIKDMEGRHPDCGQIFTDLRRHPKPGKRNQIDYLVCNNEATLLYMVNLGCIDINPWMSRTQSPEQPDFINIDLDPTDDDFAKVVETALAARDVLSRYKLKSFVKTSGKTGMHIYIPVTDITYGQARHYSELLGKAIHEVVPGITTTEISKDLRGNKVLIDPSQNDYADTLASPYSARPNHIPTVSTPLDWKEVSKTLDPSDFTIHSIGKRLSSKGDLFNGVLNETIRRKNKAFLETYIS